MRGDDYVKEQLINQLKKLYVVKKVEVLEDEPIKRELMQMQDDDKLSVYTMALSDDPDLLNALRGFSKKQPIRCADPKEIQRFFDFLAKSVSVVAAGGIPKDFF